MEFGVVQSDAANPEVTSVLLRMKCVDVPELPEARYLAHLELLGPMKLIDLSNSGGLAGVGADSRLFRGSHAVA